MTRKYYTKGSRLVSEGGKEEEEDQKQQSEEHLDQKEERSTLTTGKQKNGRPALCAVFDTEGL